MEKKNRKETPKNKPRQLNLLSLSEKDTFNFGCYPGISCFNRCCYDIDVVLTPFDVMRMKNTLGISSDAFLSKYTLFQKYRESSVPLLKLRSKDEETGECVFLSGDKGCSIYESRPLVCRNYPTGLAANDPERETVGAAAHFIIKEDICMGHKVDKTWTVPQWKENQEASELDRLNEPWMQIVAKLRSLALKDEQDQKMNIFIMVSFDLDTFRRFVFNSGFLSRFDVSASVEERIKGDDEELLKFGFQWLQFALFAEGPMKPKKS